MLRNVRPGMVHPMLSDLARRFGRYAGLEPRRTVFLEGGLGSQLLGMMTYLSLREEDPRWKCDVSYFFPEVSEPTVVGEGVRRPWELDEYGYFLDSAEFTRSRLHAFRRDYESGAPDVRAALQRACLTDWTSKFRISSAARMQVNELRLTESGVFAAIHVRRGDYLDVASRVIPLRDALSIARRIGGILPKDVVFLSDDPFSSHDKETASELLADRNCIFLDDPNPHTSHGVMRLAQVLVTSNSTFSWTAALMMEQENAIAVSPIQFFGDRQTSLNAVFQASADWMILRPWNSK